jgi:hypothetical protein
MSASYPNAWRFETAAGTIPVSWLEDTQPAPKRGDTADFDVVFVPDGRGDHVARYEALMAYADYAGQYTLHDPEGPAVAYTETHRESAPGGSLVIAVRPAGDDPTGRGVWGLIEGVSDDAAVPRKRAPATLSVAYLAPYGTGTDAYDQRYELENDLEAPTLI